MSNEKWVESLLDDMVESQWSEDIINGECGRISQMAEDLEPINRFSSEELMEQERQNEDFKTQIESFSKSDYEDNLISQDGCSIREEDCLEEIEFSDEYLEDMIRQHLEEEKDFLDRVMKEAIAEEECFLDHVEKRICENHFPDFSPSDEEEVYIAEYPVEMDIFDDLGDIGYMGRGLFKGADTDGLEEPFKEVYYEEPFFDEELCADDSDNLYDESTEFIDIASAPDDLAIEEPGDDVEELIRERLFEEKYFDRIFVEIIRKEDCWDKIIRERLENDQKLDAKI